MSVRALKNRGLIMLVISFPFYVIFGSGVFLGMVWAGWGLAVLSYLAIEIFDL